MKIKKKALVEGMEKSAINGIELSERAGISNITLSRIKNGGSCNSETACKLAKALNIAVRDLVDFEESEADDGKEYKTGDSSGCRGS